MKTDIEEQQPEIDNIVDLFTSDAAKKYFGKGFANKLCALAWAHRPQCFNGASLAEVARQRGVPKQILSRYAVRARKVFNLPSGKASTVSLTSNNG